MHAIAAAIYHPARGFLESLLGAICTEVLLLVFCQIILATIWELLKGQHFHTAKFCPKQINRLFIWMFQLMFLSTNKSVLLSKGYS